MQSITCKTCGRELPAAPVVPVVPVVPVTEPEPVAEPVAEPEPAQFAFEGYHFPASVLAKITAKLARCEISPSIETPALKTVLDAARFAYEKKCERARISSAAKRAAKKVAQAGVPQALEPEVDTVPA